MTKPVDLVVANIMHEAVDLDIDRLARSLIENITGRDQAKKHQTAIDEAVLQLIARKLLYEVAHDCPIADVLAALKAVKAPHTLSDLSDGLQAVRDRMGSK